MNGIVDSACDLGFNPERLEAARQVLADHVAKGTSPCAAAAVVRREGPAACWTVGSHTYAEDARKLLIEDRFDLASVTKVTVTATLAMLLYADGSLDLDCPVQETIPEFQGTDRERVTARMLLTHCSGLPAHAQLYRDYDSREQVEQAVFQMRLAYEPGTETAYSDMGFILLGVLVERLGGDRLDVLFRARVADPLGLEATGFRPVDRAKCVPTEQDPWRGRLVQGQVHDENAFAMGGVAPHAGLFSTVSDMARFTQAYLREGEVEGTRMLPADAIRLFRTRVGLVEGSTWALGWDTVSKGGSTAGRHFTERAFGSLGFTGTSLWIDPERDLAVVLLTNRVHPTRENWGIRELRPAFHDAVSESLVG